MFPMTVTEELLPAMKRRALIKGELREAESRWWATYAKDEEDFFWVLPQAVQPLARIDYMKKICDLLRGRQRVVDYGCGNGWTSRALSAEVGEVIGVDFSEDQLSLARSKDAGTNITYLCMDSTQDLPVADAYVFHGVLHHLSTYEITDLFLKIKYRAPPGSLIVTVEPHCFPRRETTLEAAGLIAESEAMLRDVSKMREHFAVPLSSRAKGALASINERWWGELPYGPSPLEKPFEDDELVSMMEIYIDLRHDQIVQALNVSQALSGQLALLLHDLPGLAPGVVGDFLRRAYEIEGNLLALDSGLPDAGWYMRLNHGVVR